MSEEAVFQACKEGDLLMLREWLDNTEVDPNAAIDQHRFTPLHWASWFGHMALVDLLLSPSHSARTDVVNMGEDTPLHCAAQHGHAHVIKRLLRDSTGGRNGGASATGTKYTFTPNSQVNAMNRHGNTPLHYASFFAYKDAALELINLGASVSLCNRQGKTPLDVAKGKPTGQFAQMLREAAENTGQTVTRIPFETAFEEISTRVRTIRPREIKFRTGRHGSSAAKISLDEVQQLKEASFGITSHMWRELFHGVIPGGTEVVATRVIAPMSADLKRVSRDFDAECRKLRIFSHANIHGVLSWINTEEYMLVLSELTPQFGSLYEVLHWRSDTRDLLADPLNLVRIVANIASGMEFLASRGDEHNGFLLTSKSVILTDELVAKLNISESKFSFEIPYREYNPEWCSPESLDVLSNPNAPLTNTSSTATTQTALHQKQQTSVFGPSHQVWNLAVIIWELITRKIPFADTNRFHIGFKIVYSRLRLEIPSADSLPPGPITHLARFMKMMMNEDPHQRPTFEKVLPILNKMSKRS